jgi:hypothetical protein
VTATVTVAETITGIVTRAASVAGQAVDGVVEGSDAVGGVPQRQFRHSIAEGYQPYPPIP